MSTTRRRFTQGALATTAIAGASVMPTKTVLDWCPGPGSRLPGSIRTMLVAESCMQPMSEGRISRHHLPLLSELNTL